MSDLALDSNAYIAYQANDPPVVALLNSTTRRIFPAPVLGELYFGAFNSSRPGDNLFRLESFASTCDLAIPDSAVCRRYGELRVALRKAGAPIPVNDLWIAAICLELGVPLLTRDAHFAAVAGLQTLAW